MTKQPKRRGRFAVARFREVGLAGAALLAAMVTFATAVACGPIPDYRKLVDVDLHPPVFLGAEGVAAREIALRFDEKVSVVPETITVTPPLPVQQIRTAGSDVVLALGADQGVGVEYVVGVAVEDEHRNSVSVLSRVYGYNPNVPRLLINEFINRGSGNHPDLVELYAVDSGNTAGVCIFEGSLNNWDERLILPAINVKEGEYILAHWKPQGIEAERDETADRKESGGFDASPDAYDVWLRGGNGFGANNGVISLYASPNGRLLDAVLFSNRTIASDDSYGGFGSSAMLAQVTEIVASGGWKCKGSTPSPEDCVNPDGSTATRSLGRDHRSTDSDCAADWHIVPTKGATFGGPNSDDTYVPAD